ncbi:T9SS type B sorting domain-containing protein [Niastella caeni]|uniref:T9SS type B sorting domain-containing protein n=1 Tax=Niastella caeni TaxID=2569763 RepID=A0A4S8HYM3_9BACT|nr:gliding motility-associated C-terminal domain-containing protein [Niastella caeni]THU40431.1 T9SS type B sorting domain-containing protein [Niastella caeni]
MRNGYAYRFVKQIGCLFLMLFIALQSKAQIDITIGNGTTGNATTVYPCPIQDWYEGSRSQYLYLASELTAAGMAAGTIQAIKFNVLNVNNAGVTDKLVMKIGGTTVATLSTNSWDAFTTTPVETAPTDYQAVVGSNVFTFQTPFFWNGTDNILIEICDGDPGNNVGEWYIENPTIAWTTGLSFNGSHTTISDNQGSLCGTTATLNSGLQTTRPDIVLAWVPATNCAGKPNAGTASSTLTNVCLAQNFTVSLTGQTIASGITYKWQSSTNNTTWADIPGATTSFYTASQSATHWYRAIVTCTNGGLTDTTNAVQIVSPGLVGGTFTINSGQLTGGTNFQTFADAINYIKCGINSAVVFNVVANSGPYAEQVTIPHIGGSSSVNTITFNGNGTTLAYNTSDANNRTGIILNGAKHIIIDSLNVDVSAGSYGWGIVLMNKADSNIIRRCTVTTNTTSSSTNYSGILINGSATSTFITGNNGNGNLISGNTIIGGYYGIFLYGSTNPYNANNIIEKNKVLDAYLYSVYVYGNTNLTITGNDISRPSRTSVTTGYGIYVGTNTATLIEKNRIHNLFDGATGTNNTAYCIYVAGSGASAAQPNRAENNLIYNINNGAGAIYGIYSAGYNNWNFYHNSIVLDDAAATAGTTYGCNVNGSNVNVKNNLIYITRGGTGTKYCLYYGTAGVTSSANNDLYMNAPAGTNAVGFFNVAWTTLAGWQSTGFDISSIAFDPQFVNAGSGNYRPTNVFVDNMGAALGVTSDILGFTRSSTTPDIGAIEFTSAACTSPPVAGTVISTTNPVCAGVNFTLSLTGGTAGAGQTYQWQSSPDNTTWTNITGAVSAVYTTSQTNSTWYRVAVTCGSATVLSAPLQVNTTSVSYATLPFTESFESTWINGCDNRDIPNNFWRNQPATGNNSWRRYDDGAAGAWVNPANGAYTPSASHGSYSARFHSYNASANAKGSLDFYVNCNTGVAAKRLRFDYINTTGNDSMEVLLSTDGGLTFTWLNGYTVNGSWDRKVLNFTSNSATTVIRFRSTSDFGGSDIGIDNLTMFNLENCSGTPVPGTTVSSNTMVCPGSNFTLSVNGLPMQNGLTYQWQASPDNITWTNISGATGEDLTTSQTTATWYRIFITCTNGNQSAGSVPVLVPMRAPLYAPLPYTESFENTWVNGCDTRDIPNNFWNNNPATGDESWRRNDDGTSALWSSVNGAYAPAAAQGSYSARFHSYDGSDGAQGKFDLHLNASTGAPNKRLTFSYINTSGDDSLTVLVSTNGGTSFTRLDSVGIRGAWSQKVLYFNSTSATTIIRFQATADFGLTDIGLDDILVAEWPDCSGTPNAGTAVTTNSTVCIEPFTVSATGISTGNGITYQWQKSTDSVTWNNISGATAISYTTSQVGTHWYRLVTTCTISSTSANAAPVKVVSPTPVNGTFTINNNQLPGNGNFTSFNAAYDYIKCGIDGPVTFNVHTGTGTYNEQLTMIAVPGASAVNTVTFKGVGSGVLGFASTNTNERAVIKLKGTKHIIFDSLIINASLGTYGYGVQIMSNTDSNVVRNCTINLSTTSTAQNFAGIVVNGSDAGPVSTGAVLSDDNIFSGNTITGGYYGITLVATFNNGANGNNKIIKNTIKDFYSTGIYVAGSYGTLIEKNILSRPARTSVTDFYGIYFTTEKNTGCIVSKNRISNPFGGAPISTAAFYGINFNNSSGSTGGTYNENVVSNNLIYDINGNGLIYAIANTASGYAWYFHNTISLDNITSTSTAATRGFYQTTAASGLFFYNNNISITRGGTGTKYCIYLATNLLAGCDNNNYYINAAAGTNGVGFYTAARTQLSAWRTATGLDANSLSITPAFVDPASGNFTPGNAGIDNKGAAIGTADDINDQTRSGLTPDIGAYEFSPLPCALPLVNGKVDISPDTLCQFKPVYLHLNIGAFGSGQTFQWQMAKSLAGPYTNVGTPMLTPDTTIIADTTSFYRVQITCGTNTVYTDTALLVVNPALPTGIYTINKNGQSTYEPGKPGGNFLSFADAKAAMGCGIGGTVVFNVQAGSGPYTEQLILDSIAGTSAINTITFNGNGNTLTYNANSNSQRAVLKLNGADHIIFDSLQIEAGGGTYGYGIQLINNADSNTFRKCIINTSVASTSNNYAGIVINASDAAAVTTGNTLSDGNVFDRNRVTGGYYGITLVGNTTTTGFLNNNSFTNNTIQDFYNYGLYITGTNNTVVAGNTFTRAARANTATSVYGIYMTTAASNRLTISKNRFTRFFGGITANTASFYGVYHNSVSAAGEDTVSNNLFYDLDGNGPVYALYNTGSSNVWYHHNTISIDNTTSTATGASAGFYQTTTANGIQFVNNIVTISRGGAGAKHAIYLNATTSEILSNYNDFYVTGTNAHVGYYTANRTTLADWVTASGKDSSSLNHNPLYTDPATGNFMPMLAALDNKGTPVNIATDILNAVRSATTPDIGAYEFAPAPCQTPPIAGTASVTPSSGLCLEMPIELTVTGHSPLGAITFQWQSSPDGVTWTDISPVQYFPQYSTKAGLSTYYRAAVTCTGNTVYTAPVQVTLNNILLKGLYTIDPSKPATLPNFTSFQSAVDALLCGITGAIVFEVAPGTYNEQIRIPYIPNTSTINTVTFQSANGVASSVNLTFDATSTNNYTLKLDSTRHFIFKDLTISGTNTSNGRVVELANTASYDSILNCIIAAPVATAASNSIAGIYAFQLKGTSNVIKGNTISNGSSGIYFAGTGTGTGLSPDHVIENNTVSGAWQYGIYASNLKRVQLNKNIVTVNGPVNATAYGIYATDCDSSYSVTGNNITVSNATTIVYGLALINSDTARNARGKLANNMVTAVNNNTGALYGAYLSNSPGVIVQNNTIAINTSGAGSYGLYHNNFNGADYLNNTVNSTSTTTTNNHSMYLLNTAASGVRMRNNIFSNKGGGTALYVNNSSQSLTSDYNMLYTSGSTLVQRGNPAGTFATLADWRAGSYWDKYSIGYSPAFVSDSDLRPDLVNPDVWAMHGRGVQIAGNDRDINDSTRPVTLTQGVPDLGAYEFYPTALPTVLTATPLKPVVNQPQTFMYGTDTVMRITWGPTVPDSVEARRYSGVVPAGLQPRPDSMFFYTKVEMPGGGNYDYNMELFYLDPWQGSVPDQNMLGLGKTTVSNAWVVGFSSRVDVIKKKIWQNSVNYMDRFTGLVNPYAPPVLPDKDSSNRGKRFWVGYQRSYDFNPGVNSQEMVLYMSTTDQPANVQVRINGTNWVRNYVIPPYTTRASDYMPKNGLDDARLLDEGLYNRGISIVSDVPITAYAHIFASANSGATMLFPVGVWGYEYYSLNNRQNYSTTGAYTTIMVVADKNNTVVEITPSVPTLAGKPANVPFTVTLNAGDVYQVLGAMMSGSEGYDLTGSIIKSLPNSNNECHAIGVFTGSSRTGLGCGTSVGGSGDLFLQQTFPYSAWGKTYLTAPTSTSANISTRMTNIYRVLVKDPATVVKRNNITLTNIINNRYYQYESNTADIITADKPVTMVQYMSSSGACANTGGDGDPESNILSPAEQAISGFSGFYRNNLEAINVNYLTLILPDSGMNSLKIDGIPWNAIPAATKHSYAHSQPGYTVAIKRWPAGAGQSSVESDSAYLGLVYGLGSVESYGYNVGTMVKTLQGLGTISNTLNNGNKADYTCAGTPFRFTGYLPFIPNTLTWKLSRVPGLSPNADVTVNAPVPGDSILINGVKNYLFPLNQDYTFANPGVYTIEIVYDHPDIESCDHTGRDLIYVQVVPAPKADFTVNYSGCVKDIAEFVGAPNAQNGIAVNQWKWEFHDGSKANGQKVTYTYNTAGTFTEKLQSVTADGCVGDTTKQIVVNPVPIVKVNSVIVCTGADTTLQVENPAAGATYTWYASSTGGAAIGTGPTLSLTNITAGTDYYVQETSAAGCSSERTKVSIAVQTSILEPIVSVDSVAANLVRFKWTAVPGASGYEVSLDGGNNWTTPSSGSTGLTHTVAGLQPLQIVTIIVKALSGCTDSRSLPVSQQVLPDGIFIPNSFTPNGDGLNDVLRVYGYKIKEMKLVVFNQWGEKLFESADQSRGWDGSYKGKIQPSGVYMYVCRMILTDGTTMDKKGAINLIR